MAEFWVKIEKSTPDKPEIFEIAEELSIDPDAVIGKLVRVWCWIDSNSADGHIKSVTHVLIDRLTSHKGFALAMENCGWLEKNRIPNFDRHLGESAKKRAKDSERKRKSRESAKESAGGHKESVTEDGTEGGTESGLDKRREEKNVKDKNNLNPDPSDTAKKAKAGKYNFDDSHFDYAEKMSVPVRKRFPSQKIDLEQWADSVRKLLVIDLVSIQDLGNVWRYIVHHDQGSFSWADNIRTPMKLRTKNDGLSYFNIIFNQMGKANHETGKRPNQQGIADDSNTDWIEDIANEYS